MPELPDVEVFRRYFEATSLNQEVGKVDVSDQRILQDVTPGSLGKALNGLQFRSTRRHGKFMFAGTNGEPSLVLHFGMTGYLSYLEGDDEPPNHTRVLFSFTGGQRLAYVCQRLLGLVTVTRDEDGFIESNELGPDAFAVDRETFRNTLSGRRGTAKSALTNQTVLAGIGNIYADEILFQSRIHPKTQMGDLPDQALTTLHEQTRRVLQAGIDSDVDVARMPDWFLLPHRREEEPCPRCGAGIQSLKVSSRTAYYCPSCQPEP